MTVTFFVHKATPTVNASAKDIIYGMSPQDYFSTIVTGVFGETLDNDTLIYYVYDSEGNEVDLAGYVPGGSYVLVVKYQGNENYTEMNGTTTFVVNPAKLTISVPTIQGKAGDHVVVKINVTAETGIIVDGISITVVLPDGSEILVPVVDGVAEFEYVLPESGIYKFYAYYDGDNNYTDAYAEGFIIVEEEEPQPTPEPPVTMPNTGNPLLVLIMVLISLPILGYRKR